MLGGGLLCARRNSEVTAAIHSGVPRGSAAVSPALSSGNSSPPASTIPVSMKAAVLGRSALGGSIQDLLGGEGVHSGRLISVGRGFEYLDSSLAFVGRGSYGVVYRGIQRSDGKPVAIKKMWRINVKPDELEAMKCVRNEHLVSLIDVVDNAHDDITYLVMEFCDTDLDRFMRLDSADGRLAPVEMMTVVTSIARGYQALYQKHIVHRDIKPQNVLLLLDESPAGQTTIRSAKITDFGVSRVLADDTMALCNVAGTLFYMAPEVGANLVVFSEYNAKADMWSIGVLFYQCLTGQVPFDESALCRLFLHCAGDNFDAYDLPDFPEPEHCTDGLDFRPLISGLLAIDPSKRLTPSQLYQAVGDGRHSLCHKGKAC